MSQQAIVTNQALQGVSYEIRGDLALRAQELERQGYDITQLNIGNMGLFGYRTPETMRLEVTPRYSRTQGMPLTGIDQNPYSDKVDVSEDSA